MKGKKGEFAKCVMNVEVVTLELPKYSVTTPINVSFGFNFSSQHVRGRTAVKMPGDDTLSRQHVD